MQHRIEPKPTATPLRLPAAPWTAEGTSPGIAHVIDGDATLLAVVVVNHMPPGTAAEVDAAVSEADELLARLAGEAG